MKNFVVAISLDVPASPNIGFNTQQSDKADCKGHGFAWYPVDAKAAIVSKDPLSFSESGRPKTIDDWKRFRSSTFFMNLHGASEQAAIEETQPFIKPFGGREWIFMMQGNVDINEVRNILKKQSHFYEPTGTSIAESIFCMILNRVHNRDSKKLSEVGWNRLHKWFNELNGFGSANFYISDGITTAVYKGLGSNAVCYSRRKPPFNITKLADSENIFSADFSNSLDELRTQFVFSSAPLTEEVWGEMSDGQLIAVKRGSQIWDSEKDIKNTSHPNQINLLKSISSSNEVKLLHKKEHTKLVFSPQEMQASAELVPDITALSSNKEYKFFVNTLSHEGARIMQVTHRTAYKYTEPVERSEHIYKLMPQYNRYQQLLKYSLDVSAEADEIIYRDTFENDVVHMIIEKPYSKLVIESNSLVRIHKIDPDDLSFSLRRAEIPFAWMPWQRQMMQAYLLPPELPETQLRELTDYAMSFVERNDYKLFDSMIDMNQTIYKDYKYKQGVTDFSTTAFDVYVERHGVCQDFANLLICLARLLSVPARYRMGYIYTGADYENKIQSEATHAWVELYIPYIGWRGFDPTNGKMVDQDYIRVACGRNYIDATPTSGTIYKGGGDETLTVEVKTEVVG